MWLSALLDADTTVDAWQDKPFTMLANLSLVLSWQSHFCSHRNASRDAHVTLCPFWVFTYGFSCEAEQLVDSFKGNLLCGGCQA
jgi:hypothetical protein